MEGKFQNIEQPVTSAERPKSWTWGDFSEKDFESLPETTIPLLKNRTAFTQWLNNIRAAHSSITDDTWHFSGDRGYIKELESLFGQQLFDHCRQTLRKNGKLKIVSFGGAGMRGILELRDLLNVTIKNSTPEITIVDFSLLSEAGEDGVTEYGASNDLKNGTIRLRSGFLEICDVKDAEGADVMISTNGPFFHQGNHEIIHELVKKVAVKLAPGGRAFLEAITIGSPSERTEDELGRLQYDLGKEFIVSNGSNAQRSGFFNIERLPVKGDAQKTL